MGLIDLETLMNQLAPIFLETAWEAFNP